MGIFKRNRAEPSAMRNNSTAFYFGDEIPSGYIKLMDAEPVKICINKIAALVSDMTIHLMQNTEKGNIRVKNEISKVLDVNPNAIMTRKTFIYNIARDLCKTGNSIVFPNFDSDGNITSLDYWRTASYFFANQTENSYTIMKNGVAFSPDTVCHLVLNPDEYYPYIGTGFKNMAKQAVESVCQAQATKKAFLKNDYKPAMIVSVNADIEEFQTEDGRNDILNSYISNKEQGKPWVVPAGEIDFKTVAPLSLKDLAVNEGIELDLKTTACAFGVPPFLVGVGSFNKDEYNNFISTTIRDIAEVIQQGLSKAIFENPTLFCKFNAKSLLHYNLSELSEFHQGAVAIGIESRNEARPDYDLSPVDEPGMDERTALENFIPVSKAGNQKKLKGGEDDE